MNLARLRFLRRLRLELGRKAPVQARIHRQASTYDTEMPHIHRHFLLSDQDTDVLGFGEVEVCCHGCGQSEVAQYTLPNVEFEEPLRCLLDYQQRFRNRHAGCPSFGGEMLCPPFRSRVERVDLRAETDDEIRRLRSTAASAA